jgi:hypothetical protein
MPSSSASLAAKKRHSFKGAYTSKGISDIIPEKGKSREIL